MVFFEEFLTAAMTVCVVALYSIMFILSGRVVSNKFAGNSQLPRSFSAPAGFFLSMAIFISSWCFLDAILHNARAALFIISAGMAGMGFKDFMKSKVLNLDRLNLKNGELLRRSRYVSTGRHPYCTH